MASFAQPSTRNQFTEWNAQMNLSDQQKTAMGFFFDSPYTYRMHIGIGEKGFFFQSDNEGVGFSEKVDRPYVKSVLRQYFEAISRGIECEETDLQVIGQAVSGAVAGLPYPFTIDIRRKSNNAGIVYMEKKKASAKVSDNLHKPATREAIQDFLDALSFALGLPETR
jgi:hypothetical protein